MPSFLKYKSFKPLRLIMWVQLQYNLSCSSPVGCSAVHRRIKKSEVGVFCQSCGFMIRVVNQWNASGCLPLGVTPFTSDLLRVWNIEWVQHESNTPSTSYLLLLFIKTLIYISQSSMLSLCCLCVFLYCAQNKTMFHSGLKPKAMDTCSVCTTDICRYCFVYTIFNIYHFWCNYILLICLLYLPGWNMPPPPDLTKVYFCGWLP